VESALFDLFDLELWFAIDFFWRGWNLDLLWQRVVVGLPEPVGVEQVGHLIRSWKVEDVTVASFL